MAVPTTTPDTAPVPATVPGVVTITRTPRQLWLPLLILALIAVVRLPAWLQHSPDPAVAHQNATALRFWYLTVVPVYAIALCVNFLPTRIELGESALVLRRPLRRRRVLEWRHIQAILVDPRSSRRRVAVYGDDADGRRTLLPVPFSAVMLKDPDFEEKFHLIGQAWLARRGADWELLPPPSVRQGM
ncbi:hypothetical protein KDL01_06505 [Actinospica durhamensis]|uniref:PH domain-containing protein n=1 Tax=Actinospica durhamensis TaxID=1508375 RepID=A0A941ILE0_9ACTN|nr:hypothetical protein [Actinospica durhamensis]MBR7832905.1 hypothetical protein [Actinospica durhamensis]